MSSTYTSEMTYTCTFIDCGISNEGEGVFLGF